VGVARAFGDGARASADEAMDAATAGGAGFKGSVGHFLALLEVTGAFVAEVFVCGHGLVSTLIVLETSF
jgi:hypothetical protein